MSRIEIDDLSRSVVRALIEEHLRKTHELSPPEKVFAFDASKLNETGVTFWMAWRGETNRSKESVHLPMVPSLSR
jgi:hypothetical protein